MKKLFFLIFTTVFIQISQGQVKTCQNCSGTGRIVCFMCGGRGATYTMFGVTPCFGCGGYGVMPCANCSGSGYVREIYMEYNSNNNNNNNYYNVNTSNSSPSNPSTTRQPTKVRKQCAYCSGSGELIQHEYATTFGMDGPNTYCNKCNKSWSYGTIHAHRPCYHCNGTGYYEYEY